VPYACTHQRCGGGGWRDHHQTLWCFLGDERRTVECRCFGNELLCFVFIEEEQEKVTTHTHIDIAAGGVGKSMARARSSLHRPDVRTYWSTRAEASLSGYFIKTTATASVQCHMYVLRTHHHREAPKSHRKMEFGRFPIENDPHSSWMIILNHNNNNNHHHPLDPLPPPQAAEQSPYFEFLCKR
jgi:hypothetical protein